ncbi:MAG: hypothetical protein ACRDNS_15750, partial [Trebonia sp.]
FSGFDPAHPTILSRHQDRIDVHSQPAVARLLTDYAAQTSAAGHRESRTWPYTFAAMGDGTKLDDTLRGLFDDFVETGERDPPSPFTLEGARVFERWLQEQAPAAPAGINRLLARLHERRPDLRSAYTTTAGIDVSGLLAWAREFGALEEPHLAHLLDGDDTAVASLGGVDSSTLVPTDRSRRAADRRDGVPSQPPDTVGPLHREPFGVNVVGYFRSELGTGEAARQMVAALDAQRVPLLPIHGQTVPISRQGHRYETAEPEDAPFPVNLICMNADVLPEFARQAGTEFFAGRYSIGLWFWEVSRFPERWRESFSLLEEVWAPTEHIAQALRPLATVPVHVVRLPVAPADVEPLARAELGLDDDSFLFLFSFDYLSVAERKNPLAAVAAFSEAFAPSDGAQLVIKCINHERDPEYHARLRSAIAARPDIVLVDRYLSAAQNAALPALCDSYVSLHRAEGFGLVLADAMWHAKPVIATAYSGNLDFMTASNSLRVDCELVPIGDGFDPYPADGVWAQPDVAHAARLMRQVYEDRDGARRLGETAANEIRRSHSPDAAGAIAGERLEAIRATGRVRPRGWSAYARSPALSTLPRRIRQGPRSTTAARSGARGLIRGVALRAMRPFTAYQQDVNRQVVDA